MKRLLIALVLLLACASMGLAAENLTGVYMKGKNAVVRDGLAIAPTKVTGTSTVFDESFIEINRATNATATITYTPSVGQWFVISQNDVHTAVATVSLPTGWTWNGSNKSATFNARFETLFGFCPASTRVIIMENVGSVGFAD